MQFRSCSSPPSSQAIEFSIIAARRLDAGLVAALEWLARGFTERSGIKVDFHANGKSSTSPQTAPPRYRVAQEALTNIRKYANAGHVHMQLFALADEIVLKWQMTVKDSIRQACKSPWLRCTRHRRARAGSEAGPKYRHHGAVARR